MKIAIWASFLAAVLSLGSAVMLWTLYQRPDEPWLLNIPPAGEAQVNQIGDLERLRDVTLYLLRTDRAINEGANRTLQLIVTFSVLGFAVTGAFSTLAGVAAMRGARPLRQK